MPARGCQVKGTKVLGHHVDEPGKPHFDFHHQHDLSPLRWRALSQPDEPDEPDSAVKPPPSPRQCALADSNQHGAAWIAKSRPDARHWTSIEPRAGPRSTASFPFASCTSRWYAHDGLDGPEQRCRSKNRTYKSVRARLRSPFSQVSMLQQHIIITITWHHFSFCFLG